MLPRVIRWLAIVSLAVAVLFDITLYLGMAAPISQGDFAPALTFHFAYTTTQLLCFATGTLALVPAAQRRHLAWVVMLLAWLIIAGYGPMALEIYWVSGYQPGSFSSSTGDTAAVIFPFATYIIPQVPALIALLYTLFTQPRRAAIPHSDDALQVEITALRTPDNAQ